MTQPPAVLAGPVDVCVAVPKLTLDRPFTYLLPEDAGAGMGSLVSVPFHGRTARGWVLGPAGDIPDGRLLPVRAVRSPVRFFDPTRLALLRWVSERLAMGHYTRVTQAISRMKRRPGRKHEQLRRKLRRLE